MKAYKYALQEIYPEKEIKCALIWTSCASVMLLNDDLFERVQL